VLLKKNILKVGKGGAPIVVKLDKAAFQIFLFDDVIQLPCLSRILSFKRMRMVTLNLIIPPAI
jgi:hypothetical protein